MAMLFHVLGPLRVCHVDGRVAEIGAGEQERVLCALLLRPNEWVSSDSLVEAVWPDRVLVSPEKTLWTCVHKLRRRTPLFDGTAARIDSRPGRHRVNIADGELDSVIFEELISDGWAELSTNAERAARCFRDAVGLWRGVPFEPLRTYHSRFEAARLAQLRWDAVDGLVDAMLATGLFADAVALLHALTAEEPSREQTWLRLVDVLNHAGRPIEAEAAFRNAVRAVSG
jgi:DNA-binding SARP family transcriptional activator